MWLKRIILGVVCGTDCCKVKSGRTTEEAIAIIQEVMELSTMVAAVNTGNK